MFKKLMEKISKKLDVPFDYKMGYAEGFRQGVQFSQRAHNDMYKMILKSERVKEEIIKEAVGDEERYKKLKEVLVNQNI